ncbi:MAG: alanine racemase [Acidobacteriota bacterium]|nr:alanine racemase [Acidobacteriota bacterium]
MTDSTPQAPRIADLDTPALLIDLDIMERNLTRVADYARQHDLRVRPHTKSHKIPALGRMQIAHGAAGLTVAKVGEAEVMLNAEPEDILVAYPVIGRRKLERLMQVAARTNLTVALDSLFAARQLSDAAREVQREIAVLAEVDLGLGRVGVLPGAPLLELAHAIARLPWLRFEGITFYPGHIKLLDEDGRNALNLLSNALSGILRELRQAGLPPKIVSGGSTPTLWNSHQIAGLNEIRPGTYIFNDRNTFLSQACTMQDCAASILTTVVSTAKKGQIIIDGGSKTFSSDRPAAGSEVSFGHVVEAPDAVFGKMNEEHGFVDIRRANHDFSVGDRLRVIPNHICVAMNLHETVYGVRGDAVEQAWKVEGRGKLQ